ncbi:CHAD domain-containing protein [Phytopseudomonas dryadis]|uniref:Metal-chelation protein CHAD n=1 Tax=Phytopseudomonas dryadis TaxID=2487520 RepID=A0A4Q9RCA4_9GAMM|nr:MULTISPECIES: CHAD domain-containing protein [Pseudomonas]TBU97669.1 metal-chelation protein CHAD [Pseudomonas dryadis]TBV10123.1 metal-chelation protein CHAD [Pseudomonas dryadis]TBV19045.1 metal-chelation protein CHAD [Pseudomonas sp. FRB 230]
MAGFVPELRAEVLRQQMTLYACRERLVAHTDSEALHDLRVALRRLRSLLKPLKGAAGSDLLQQRAAELGRLSGPLRDLEVLIAHLRQCALDAAADRREPRWQQGVLGLLGSRSLSALLLALDEWPQVLNEARADGQLDGLKKRVRRYLRKQRSRLSSALQDPAHDGHRLRLLIKRVRYTAEAYPDLAAVPAAQIRELKKAQSALGDWHDHQQWLARAEQEPDLLPRVPVWQRSMLAAERRAEGVLAELESRLAE